MLNSLWENLSKNQKITFLVVIQIFIIIILAVILNSVLGSERQHVTVENESVLSNVPESDRQLLNEQLWGVIQNNVTGVDRSVINDAVVRDGTYEETDDENGNMGATFLLDIDSIKQTYAVSIVWSTDSKNTIADSVYINCPPIDQMKYPETVCHGMYNDTYSLDLYLPYIVYPEGYDDENAYPMAPNYLVEGDEDAKTIDIMVSSCAPDKYKEEALKYLESTPIDLSDYQINYTINSTDVNC